MERRHFASDLQTLKTRLLVMAGLVEDRVRQAIESLVERQAALAERVAEGDREVNELQIEIDERCLTLLALQNPLASDLRLITGAKAIDADLERIGDQAVNIAEHALKLVRMPVLKPLVDIPRMAEIAGAMVRDSIDAFVRRDPVLARTVLARDDQVDELKNQVFRELLTYMMADPSTIERAILLILVSRCLERIADHATNIAETVIFMVEARDVRHHHEERRPSNG